jgi:hypothetical protein
MEGMIMGMRDEVMWPIERDLERAQLERDVALTLLSVLDPSRDADEWRKFIAGKVDGLIKQIDQADMAPRERGPRLVIANDDAPPPPPARRP